ncbi:unnamed protein product [Fasciola hepatica]|uniref:Uncharacterized protein n=1 Tax=Fasciola hepatica TaxID=6192 RepID=A0ABC9HIU0_FASHE
MGCIKPQLVDQNNLKGQTKAQLSLEADLITPAESAVEPKNVLRSTRRDTIKWLNRYSPFTSTAPHRISEYDKAAVTLLYFVAPADTTLGLADLNEWPVKEHIYECPKLASTWTAITELWTNSATTKAARTPTAENVQTTLIHGTMERVVSLYNSGLATARKLVVHELPGPSMQPPEALSCPAPTSNRKEAAGEAIATPRGFYSAGPGTKLTTVLNLCECQWTLTARHETEDSNAIQRLRRHISLP